MLSDALIAVAVVSMLALLVHSALRSASEADLRITNSYLHSEEQFETAIQEIGECVCEEESADVETADISLNSF